MENTLLGKTLRATLHLSFKLLKLCLESVALAFHVRLCASHVTHLLIKTDKENINLYEYHYNA